RIATSESWRDKQTGEQQERTEWHRVAFFGRLAEVAGEYLRKGSQVYIEGSLRTRKWQDKQGNERYSTEIIGNDLQMLGGRGGGAVSAPSAGAAASGGAGASGGGGAGGGGGGGGGRGGGGGGRRRLVRVRGGRGRFRAQRGFRRRHSLLARLARPSATRKSLGILEFSASGAACGRARARAGGALARVPVR